MWSIKGRTLVHSKFEANVVAQSIAFCRCRNIELLAFLCPLLSGRNRVHSCHFVGSKSATASLLRHFENGSMNGTSSSPLSWLQSSVETWNQLKKTIHISQNLTIVLQQPFYVQRILTTTKPYLLVLCNPRQVFEATHQDLWLLLVFIRRDV